VPAATAHRFHSRQLAAYLADIADTGKTEAPERGFAKNLGLATLD
jgi:hypothetical protein